MLKPRERGRPVDARKDAAILAAAERLFLERGFAKTTIEQVARAAAVSRVTLYARYPDKEALFVAACHNKIGLMDAEMILDPDDDRPIRERLCRFGATLMSFIFSPELLAFDATIVSEARRAPDLGARFFAAGPGRKRDQLAAIVARAAERGEIGVDDPVRAAEDLLSLWNGFLHVKMKFGVLPALDRAEIEGRAAHGVDLFLKAYAPA